MPYILYINLKNLNWPTQSVLPNGLSIDQKPHAIFITGISDFSQITWVQDWVSAGCEVTVEIAGDVVGELPAWVSRVSLLYTHNYYPNLIRNDKVVINADYTIDNRLAWPTHQIALQKLLPHVQHLSVYGLQRHDIKQALQAWLATQGWGFYDAFHAKPLAAQPCRFLVDSYNLQMPLLGVGAGAYSRWPVGGQWFERKLNSQGKGAWQKLTTK